MLTMLMKITYSFVHKASSLMLAFALVATSFGPLSVLADHDPFNGFPQTSVTLCHAEGNGTYHTATPNVSGGGGNLSLQGHQNDNGINGGDIIPPFHYTSGNDILSYPGKNWVGNAANQAIWANNCSTPTPPAVGTITIDKVVVGVGADANLDFDFDVSWSGTNVMLSGSDAASVNSALPTGAYTIVETGTLPTGWALTNVSCSGDANGSTNLGTKTATVNLDANENVTCTFTNTYTAPTVPDGTITVTKVVLNDSGTGSSTVSNFALSVGTEPVVSGVSESMVAGTYQVSETGPAGYTAIFSNGCTSTGMVTVVAGQAATCTITNDDNAPAAPTDIDLGITKGIDDNTPNEGQTVTYTVAVTNTSVVTATNVSVADLIPTTLDFVSASTVTGSYDSNTGVWTVGSLTTNQVATLTITATVDAGTAGSTIINTAVASATQNDSNPGNNTASVNAVVNRPVTPGPTCNVTIVSDTTNTVNELGDATAAALTFIHTAWTASVPGATWIWGTDPVADTTVTTSQTFKKTFDFNGPVTAATLNVAADNSYTVKLNGVTIGGDVSGDNFALGTQDTYNNVAGIITGTNTLEITVTNIGVANSNAAANPAGLLYKLSVDGSDPDCAVVPTTTTTTTGGGGGGGSSRRGSSNNNDDDEGEVLGAQTEILPAGAPNTGMGGMASTGAFGTILGLMSLLSLVGYKKRA